MNAEVQDSQAKIREVAGCRDAAQKKRLSRTELWLGLTDQVVASWKRMMQPGSLAVSETFSSPLETDTSFG